MASDTVSVPVPDVLEAPPRMVGVPETDLFALNQWIWALYQNFVLGGGVLTARAQPTAAIDPVTGRLQVFPVGSIYITVLDGDPADLLGYGTWARFGNGRAIIAVDETYSPFDAAEKTGGAKTVALSVAEMPSHTHVQDPHNHTQDPHSHGEQVSSTGAAGGTSGAVGSTVANDTTVGTTAAATATNQAQTATNQVTGGGAAHENLPPFITAFLWKRTA